MEQPAKVCNSSTHDQAHECRAKGMQKTSTQKAKAKAKAKRNENEKRLQLCRIK